MFAQQWFESVRMGESNRVGGVGWRRDKRGVFGMAVQSGVTWPDAAGARVRVGRSANRQVSHRSSTPRISRTPLFTLACTSNLSTILIASHLQSCHRTLVKMLLDSDPGTVSCASPTSQLKLTLTAAATLLYQLQPRTRQSRALANQ